MQRQCLFTNNDFIRLLPSPKFRRYNAIFSGMNIAAERKEDADFTQAYSNSSATMIAVKDRYYRGQRLKGNASAWPKERPYRLGLQSVWPEIATVNDDNYQNTLLDNQQGRLDAIFVDTVSMRELLKRSPTGTSRTAGNRISLLQFWIGNCRA